MPTSDADRQACFEVLDRYMEALNAHDAAAMDREMRFPHVRLANGSVKVYPEAGSNPMDLFEALTRQSGWSHSRWEEREIVQADSQKIHVALTYTRFRGDGSAIGVYASLYVLTYSDGRWKIQARSSFGP